MATQPAKPQALESPLATPITAERGELMRWQAAQSAVRTLLSYIGEDYSREGLMDTPARVVKALAEMTTGYQQDPRNILGTTFDVEFATGEPVLVRNIEFHSLCEHHLLGFSGVAHVAYVPRERVVGLSKIARLVDCFARRLQVQERLTWEIMRAIDLHLSAVGVGVLLKAHHSCMGCRGVRKPGADMVTTAFSGQLADPARRKEFLSLLSV